MHEDQARPPVESTYSLAGTPAIEPWAKAGRVGGQRPLDARQHDVDEFVDREHDRDEADARPRRSRAGRRAGRPSHRRRSASSGANRRTSGSNSSARTGVRDQPRRAPSGVATTRTPGSGSSAGTVALRVVERGRRHDRLAAVDLDPVGERRAACCQPSITVLPSSGDAQLPDTWPTISPSTEDRRALDRRVAVHREAVQPARWSGSLAVRSSAARPMNRGLSIRTAQSIPTPARRRVELGVHADDHVALLEPQPEQRLEAVRPDPEVRAERP